MIVRLSEIAVGTAKIGILRILKAFAERELRRSEGTLEAKLGNPPHEHAFLGKTSLWHMLHLEEISRSVIDGTNEDPVPVWNPYRIEDEEKGAFNVALQEMADAGLIAQSNRGHGRGPHLSYAITQEGLKVEKGYPVPTLRPRPIGGSARKLSSPEDPSQGTAR